MRGIVIAGTHSGCGKTTVTLGIMAALRKRGLAVQPFKAGPDFIDAGLHRLVADRPSRNLDQWMCGQDYVIDCFMKYAADADIAVVEGVMGMHDGDFSTDKLARLLQAPVILVVDAYGMAESAGAVVHGFAEFRVLSSESGVESVKSEIGNPKSALSITGVIFNRVASENHYKRLKESVINVPVFGYLPRDLNFEIPHRHLGLTIAEESPFPGKNIDKLADAVLKYINVEQLIQIAKRREMREGKSPRPPLFQRGAEGGLGKGGRGDILKPAFRIAVAYDKAFSFYYEDNLDLLRDAGAEIIRFSPLSGPAVPDNADAVYIGGGYPEIHAAVLSRNSSMLSSIRAWADAGKPMYAECGGLMYLSKGIRDFDNTLFPMTGVFPFETRMMKKPRLGYREILLNNDCILGSKGEKHRGHEFHYSEIREDRVQGPGSRGQGNVYSVTNASGDSLLDEGFKYKSTLASYIHVHFGSNERSARHFAGFIKGERTA
jgi:cobyrinic acid a,c-diamide synthase